MKIDREEKLQIIREGMTRLMVAAERGDTAEMKDLIDNQGAALNERANRATALIVAAAAGKIDAVNFLLKRNAETHHQDSHGADARFYADVRGFGDIVKAIDAVTKKNKVHGGNKAKKAFSNR